MSRNREIQKLARKARQIIDVADDESRDLYPEESRELSALLDQVESPESAQWRRSHPPSSQPQERFPQREQRAQERVSVAPQCWQEGFGFTTNA